MGSFGDSLRREREMRGITLEEISAATKISGHLLQAIEADEFAKLPGGIYTRNFVRAYVRYLGLDEERVMSEFQTLAIPGAEIDLRKLTFAKPQPRRESAASIWALVLAAVALLACGYALYRYAHRPLEAPRVLLRPETGQEPQAATTGATSAEHSGSEPQAGPQKPEAGSTETQLGPATSLAATADQSGNLVLQVAATELAWAQVTADGKTVLERSLKPNEVLTFKAKEHFHLRVGNAAGIVLTLNQQTLPPLGGEGDVKDIDLSRSDLKQPTP